MGGARVLRYGLCLICGDQFQTRSRSPQTCGQPCIAVYRQLRIAHPGLSPEQYSPALIQQFCELYGLSESPPDPSSDTRSIPLTGKRAAGRVAIVDEADYKIVFGHTWYFREQQGDDQHRSVGPYAKTTMKIDGRPVVLLMHQLITGWPLTDHRNGNGLDNRRSNLRHATPAQNAYNAQGQLGHSSRFKGVTWHKGVRKWQATIKAEGKNHYLGVFESEEDAARAYEEAALNLHGSYAYAAREPS